MRNVIPPFHGWTDYTPTVPALYWDVYSSEERIKKICCTIHKIIEYSEKQTEQININKSDIAELKELFEQFQKSGFNDYYREQVEKWIDEHTRWIFEHVAKQVFFGLTSDGYFCAYIPDGWQDIQFDTGAVYGTGEYGRLILRFNVDNASGVINNTSETLAELAEQVRANSRSINENLYTPLNG